MKLTTTSTTRSTLALLAASALALPLAACSGGDDAEETTSAEETSTTATDESSEDATEETSQTPTDEASETAEPTESASPEETTAPAGGGDVAACMLGDWEMDQQAMISEIEAQMGGLAQDIEMAGTSLATITPTSIDSTIDYTQSFTFDLGETGTGTAQNVAKGSVSVAYTLAGDVLTYGAVISGEGSIVSTQTFPGAEPITQEMPLADVNAASDGLSTTVTCDDSTLTMTMSEGGVSVSQVFTRR